MTTLPKCLVSERALLGACLLYRGAIDQAGDLAPAELMHPLHVALWEALRSLQDAREPIAAPSVIAALKHASAAERCARMVRTFAPAADPDSALECYLVTLETQAGTADSVPYLARQIRAASTLRRLAEWGESVTARALTAGADADVILEDTLREIGELAAHSAPAEDVEFRQVLREVVDGVEARFEGREALGIATGFERLDAVLGGLRPGHLVVIAGRPAMGKTALAMEILRHLGTQDGPVPALIVSLEMSRRELGERTVAAEGRIDGWRLQQGRLQQRDWSAFAAATSRLATAPIRVVDASDLTIGQIRAIARRWRARRTDPAAPAVVVVDYIQLVDADAEQGHRRQSNREQEVARVSRGLKRMAKELRVPVIALAQLNRQVEARGDNRRPRISDLRESGQIEADADTIALLYRDEIYNPESKDRGIVEVIIGKARHGDPITIRLGFTPGQTRFDDAPTSDVIPFVARGERE